MGLEVGGPGQPGSGGNDPERARQNGDGPFVGDPRAGSVGDDGPHTGIRILNEAKPEEPDSESLFKKDPRASEIFDVEKDTGIEVRSSENERGATKAKMDGGDGSSPDAGVGAGGGRVVDGEYVGDFEEDKDKTSDGKKGENEKKENNYNWKDFSSKVRSVISSERLDEIQHQIVNDLESVGVRIRILFEEAIDTSDVWDRKRAGREFLGKILDDIDSSVELDENKKKFIVEGIGVEEKKLSEWIAEVKKEKGGEKKKAEPDQSKTEGVESEEKRKNRLAKEAHDALDNLIRNGGTDSIDESLFINWISNHGGNATQADYDIAHEWLKGIATRKEEKIDGAKRAQAETERLREEREERLDRDRKNAERLKTEKEEREKRDRKQEEALKEQLAEEEKAARKLEEANKIREISKLNRAIGRLGTLRGDGSYSSMLVWLNAAQELISDFDGITFVEITGRISILQDEVARIRTELPRLKFDEELKNLRNELTGAQRGEEKAQVILKAKNFLKDTNNTLFAEKMISFGEAVKKAEEGQPSIADNVLGFFADPFGWIGYKISGWFSRRRRP